MSGELLVRELERLAEATRRFREAVAVPEDAPLAVDGTIQRFEFCFELSWKALKRALEMQGVERATPRAVLRAAYQAELLDDEATWLRMLEFRNLTSHTYNQPVAVEVYRGVLGLVPAFDALLARLERVRESGASGQ